MSFGTHSTGPREMKMKAISRDVAGLVVTAFSSLLIVFCQCCATTDAAHTAGADITEVLQRIAADPATVSPAELRARWPNQLHEEQQLVSFGGAQRIVSVFTWPRGSSGCFREYCSDLFQFETSRDDPTQMPHPVLTQIVLKRVFRDREEAYLWTKGLWDLFASRSRASRPALAASSRPDGAISQRYDWPDEATGLRMSLDVQITAIEGNWLVFCEIVRETIPRPGGASR